MTSEKFVSPTAGNMHVTTTSSAATNKPQQPAISYILYLHREELRKRKASCIRISRTKFQLTHELITKTITNIHKCTADDLRILSRESIFRKNLRRQIARMKHLQHIQLMKYQQQKNTKFQKQQRPQQYLQSDRVDRVTDMEGIETLIKS